MRTPPANRPPDNIWFRLLVPAGFLFCATALSWVMSSFGDQRAPISRLLSRYAVWAILVESIAIVAFAILAMTIDRRQSLKNKAASSGPVSPDEAAMSDVT